MNPEVIYYPQKAVLKALKKLPTPFFFYEEKKLRQNCQTFRQAFQKYFPDFEALYAIKANPNPQVVRIIKAEGFGADCSSEAEAWLASKLGLKGMYSGNYTTEAEFRFVKNHGFILNLDDISMIPTIQKLGMPTKLSFRINPGIGKATLESNVFAGPDAKYGVPHEKAAEAYKKAKAAGVKHFGIHMMTGSNVPLTEKDYFEKIVDKLFEIIAEIKKTTGIEIEFMNMGGGFGVPYRPEETSLNMSDIAKSVRRSFDRQCRKYGLKEPKLMAEPGRFICANMGWLVTKIHVIKAGYKKFVGVDSSTNDMPRPLIYGAYHHISVLNTAAKNGPPPKAAAKNESVSVVGRICENNDQFAKDRLLPECKVGDTIIIHNCGAHARSMGHNYNGRTRAAEYLLRLDGTIQQVRKAETIQDLYRGTFFAHPKK